MSDRGSKQRRRGRLWLFSLLGAAVFLVTCDGKSDRGVGTRVADVGGRTFEVCSGENALRDALIAFTEAREGDVIEFCAGRFELATGLILQGKRGITIRGAGKDRTILAFAESDSSEGINASHVDGLVIEGLTVEDTPGNAIRVFRSRFVTIRDVRTRWSDCQPDRPGYQPCAENGAYGLYPVECRHVLIEDSESIGASDAGIYVGQTSDVIVRRTRAEYNVAGFEFENT